MDLTARDAKLVRAMKKCGLTFTPYSIGFGKIEGVVVRKNEKCLGKIAVETATRRIIEDIAVYPEGADVVITFIRDCLTLYGNAYAGAGAMADDLEDRKLYVLYEARDLKKKSPRSL